MGRPPPLRHKCTEAYDPGGELAIRWNDPALGIEWPAEGPVLSPRDAAAPLLSEIEPALLPR
jgi:dTDP-4-dehydrorhamnose 3,5-epimerase